MKYDNMVIVVQSRMTGRFLLVEGPNGWTWPSVKAHSVELAMLADSIVVACQHMGIEHLPDDTILNFVEVPERIKLMVFHCWIDQELMGTGKVEWHSLFDFPEYCDPMVTKVLKIKHLQSVIVDPAI